VPAQTVVTAQPAAGQTARRVVWLSLIGYAVDWYDFAIYATVAAIAFPRLFFPRTDPQTAVLASFVTFTAGFIARPVGGAVFGALGDRAGRKAAFVASLLAMGVLTTLIGLMPTYAGIGVAAPALLVVLRLIQGVVAGSQFAAASLLTAEYAPADRRGLHTGIAQLGAPLSDVIANLIFLFLTLALTTTQFDAWGWRVPFLLGIAPVLVGLYAQRWLGETPAFRARSADLERFPIATVFRRHPLELARSAGLAIGYTATVYILLSYMLAYGTQILKFPRSTMLAAVLVAEAFGMLATVVFARLSDRLGRRAVYGAGAALAAIWAFPFFWLADARSLPLLLLALFVAQVFVRMMLGPLAALLTEMFPTGVRYSGVSVGYQVGSILGGALAPPIAAGLLALTHNSLSISVYMAIVALVALASVAFAGERRSQPLE
jgi:MFS family permease